MPPMSIKNIAIGVALLAAAAWYLQSRTTGTGQSKPLFNWLAGGL